MNPAESHEWSELQEIDVKPGQEFFANDYVSTLESIDRVFEVGGVKLEQEDVAVKATIKVRGEHGEYTAEPYFIIRDRRVARLPEEISDLGLRLTLMNIHPESGKFSLGINTRQKDWVVIKAIEKPYINVLWVGTGVLMLGFGIAMVRRFREFMKMKAKGQE
jgi:cytochrome c-type biogenesis protein CcmF